MLFRLAIAQYTFYAWQRKGQYGPATSLVRTYHYDDKGYQLRGRLELSGRCLAQLGEQGCAYECRSSGSIPFSALSGARLVLHETWRRNARPDIWLSLSDGIGSSLTQLVGESLLQTCGRGGGSDRPGQFPLLTTELQSSLPG